MRFRALLLHLTVPLVALAIALAASLGCVGTPLPDPPSARADLMTLTDVPPNAVRLDGAMGAIDPGSDRPGAATLRVTNADFETFVVVPVDETGAFSAELAAALDGTLHLELVDPEGDVFLAAVALVGESVVEVDDGGDRDGDLSPDAVDCAPDDGSLASRECPAECGTDADCAVGEMCFGGVCSVMVTEICENRVDDDLDGLTDERPCL